MKWTSEARRGRDGGREGVTEEDKERERGRQDGGRERGRERRREREREGGREGVKCTTLEAVLGIDCYSCIDHHTFLFEAHSLQER